MQNDEAKNNWFDPDSQSVNFCDIIDDIKNSNDFELFVGCDSHKISEKYIFAIVIALYKPGWGGRFYFRRIKMKDERLSTIKIRLIEEIELAINTARSLRDRLPDKTISVHLDINTDERYRSSVVLPYATSYVLSSGFQMAVKPLAWASSSIADAFAR